MIQCVGSRDAEHPYCSRVCCADAIKNALRIKALAPETNVYVLYRDIRTYGFKESYYTKARQQGVVFVRYDEDRKPEVARNSHALERHRLRPDPGHADVDSAPTWWFSPRAFIRMKTIVTIAQFLKVPLNSDGFFLEAHMKLRPVDFMTDGVFLCGLAHSPKSDRGIHPAGPGSGRASSGRAVQDSLELGANISQVVDEQLRWLCLLRGHLSLQVDHPGRIHVARVDQEDRRDQREHLQRLWMLPGDMSQERHIRSRIYAGSNQGAD